MNVNVFGEHNVLDTMNRLQRSNVHVTLAQTRSQKMLVGGGAQTQMYWTVTPPRWGSGLLPAEKYWNCVRKMMQFCA